MPARRPELLRPVSTPPPPRSNRLLSLLEAYRFDRAALSVDEDWEVRMHLRSLWGQFSQEQMSFSEASFIDSETVCIVFRGESGGLSLIVDQEWSVSGGIVFSGMRVEPLRL